MRTAARYLISGPTGSHRPHCHSRLNQNVALRAKWYSCTYIWKSRIGLRTAQSCGAVHWPEFSFRCWPWSLYNHLPHLNGQCAFLLSHYYQVMSIPHINKSILKSQSNFWATLLHGFKNAVLTQSSPVFYYECHCLNFISSVKSSNMNCPNTNRPPSSFSGLLH